MSADREFQVDGAATESATGQFGVYARNDEHRSIGRAHVTVAVQVIPPADILLVVIPIFMKHQQPEIMIHNL